MKDTIMKLSLLGAAGGIGSIAFTFAYAFTHGTTTVNQMGSLLGLNELQWGQLSIIIPVLLWFSLLAFRLRMGSRLTKLGAMGFRVASTALVLLFLSEVPQFFIDMRTEYESLLGLCSWMTYLFSLPVLTIGLLLVGIGCRQTGTRRTACYVPAILALTIIPTLAAGGLLSSISDDRMVYRIIGGLLSVPQGMAWVWLALVPDKK